MYDADSYSDDELPYWVQVGEKPHLVVPYTLDANDMRFACAQGFNSGTQFFTYLKDSFDFLYQENQGRVLSVGCTADWLPVPKGYGTRQVLRLCQRLF